MHLYDRVCNACGTIRECLETRQEPTSPVLCDCGGLMTRLEVQGGTAWAWKHDGLPKYDGCA